MKIGCKVDVGVTESNKKTLIARTDRPKGRVVENEGWKIDESHIILGLIGHQNFGLYFKCNWKALEETGQGMT